MSLFAQVAPAYYAHGLNVIPLYPREKKPAVNAWSKFAEENVPADLQKQWMDHFPDGNIGLALGRASGVMMIDIDTDDPVLMEAIVSVLPSSPWVRKGKKGMMLAYKWSPIRTFRVKNTSGEMLVECLAGGTQCVLPPSIHPDTQKPYEANVPLYEVLGALNYLSEDIEKQLRDVLQALKVPLSHSGWSKVTEFVSAGSRDTTLTELAGLFAFAVVRGERTLKQAIGMLSAYGEEFTENVAGDAVDIDKHVQNLIKFLHRDVVEKQKILPKGWDEGYTREQLDQMGVTIGDDETSWAFEEARDFLRDQFEANAENEKAKAEAVEKVLVKLSKSPDTNRVDTDRILKYIADVSGLNVGMATLRARLKELKMGAVRGEDHSEIARHCLNDISQYQKLAFDKDQFWKWGGSHWVVVDRSMIQAKVAETYGHMDACRKFSDIAGVVKVMALLADQGIKKQDAMGINFANGFLNQDLMLLPHNPEYGMTYTLPFRYRPEEAGGFPMFQKFLHTSWGHDSDYEEKIMALQEALCVTLFGLGPRFQRVILCHGAAGSGKTQLLRIVESLMTPEARCVVPPEDWSDKFLPTQMMGKIVNIVGELSERNYINGQRFKDIVDGSEMPGQFKGQQIFKFKPMVTHWFASNHFPKTHDTSAGFTRRWLVLSFNRPVPPHERVADIGDQIAGVEREAIVAWAAQALPRLKENNDYTLPLSHKMMMNEVSNINNSVRFFLVEGNRVKVGGEKVVEESKIFNLYWAFCNNVSGLKAVPLLKFRAMLRELQNELGFRMKVETKRGCMTPVIQGMEIV